MIHSPNLDDKTYQEIVDEAIRLIPHYCPEWTNHNPSDPGITLIELFAWMTEMMIYRLNQVPDKVYLTLLDLIGLSLTPPLPAKSLLTFFPVEGYNEDILVKRGTKVSTAQSETSGIRIFETVKDLVVSNIKLEACISTKDGKVTDNTGYLINGNYDIKGFSLFSGEEDLKRYVYLSDPSFAFLSDKNVINITFSCTNEIKTVSDEITNFLEWEYWNGKKWIPTECARSMPGVKKQDNEIYFIGPMDIQETTIEKSTGFFLRGSLVSIPERSKCFELENVLTKLLFHGEGLNPDMCLCNTDNMIFQNIDISKDFKPFINIPKYNDAFYIASDEAFSKEDSEIIISVYLSDAEDVEKPEPNENLLLKYEYWNGKNWIDIGETSIKGVFEPQGKFNFTDTTDSFTKNGDIRFKRPEDLMIKEVYGQEKYWIRVRIGAGDFGTGGQYKFDDEGKWEWFFDKHLRPPVLSSIKLRYIASKKPLKYLFSYYDFSYFNFTKNIHKNFSEVKNSVKKDISKIDFFRIFEINKEKCPISYFGFNKKFSSGSNSIFFKMNETKSVKPARLNIFGNNRLGIDVKRSKRPISLKWEYCDGKKWKPLSVNDYTDSFHESGFIDFKCPEDISFKKEFGKDLIWLRLIFESGSFEINPKVININLNSVYAYNQQSYENELLGSSNGTPSQVFSLLHSPILPGIQVIVREYEAPPANERNLIMKEEGKDAINIKKGSGGIDEVWIRYHEVDNFYASTPKSRHFCVDYHNNKIIFGDGLKGVIPPRIKNNIRVARYFTGGGSEGNVGSETITSLREKIPYISAVTNLYSAERGSDLEDIDRLKARATNVFKNLNRAVTIEDYEWLATESSTSVVRAKCLSKCGKNGEVIVIIVPKPELDDINFSKKLYPTAELLRRVKEYLDVRKMVGTRLRVEPPAYKKISIDLRIVFRKDISELQQLKERIELSIQRYLNPITGGQKGKGWEFGMTLTKNEIFNVLEKINGIYYIEEIEIRDTEAGIEVEKLILEEDELIYIDKINIIEREYQY